MDAQQAAAARREALGLVIVDESVMEQLRADAAPVVETVATPAQAQQRHHRDRALDDLAVTTIPTAELAELRYDAAVPGQIAARAQHERSRTALVAAMQTRAITPAEGRAWARHLDADPDAVAQLEALPAGRAAHLVPTEMIGHANHDPDEPLDEAIYTAAFGAHR